MSIEKSLEVFNLLKAHQIKCGIALKTDVDANQYERLLKVCDYACVMSVVPGKGGQSFMQTSIDNLKKVNAIKNQFNPNLIVQLDGGVNLDVMRFTKDYVDHFIIGSFLMKQSNKQIVFDFLKEI
jgi:ribulose-phosphate 3-epimerase